MNVEFLKKRVADARALADTTSERSSRAPDDFWLRIVAENQRQAVSDAEHELTLAYAEEAGELLDLRLTGPKA